MEDHQIFKKLADLKDIKAEILTVCLASPEKRAPHPTFFSSQLHSLAHNHLSSDNQKRWADEVDKIDKYLREHLDKSNTKSIVFFVSNQGLWEVLSFNFFLSPFCIVAKGAHIQPIEQALRAFPKYLVVLVDREKVRLFSVYLGKIEEHKDVAVKDVPQKVKAKKVDVARERQIERHIDDHLHRHLKIVAQQVYEFALNKHIHFIIIGGHKELFPKFREHLPYPFNKMVLGEFVTELKVPLNKIFEHSEKIAQRIIKKLQM